MSDQGSVNSNLYQVKTLQKIQFKNLILLYIIDPNL